MVFQRSPDGRPHDANLINRQSGTRGVDSISIGRLNCIVAVREFFGGMPMFLFRPLARLFLIGSVCLLTVAQTTRAFSSITLLDVPAVANLKQGFARPAVEEVGSRPLADGGVLHSVIIARRERTERASARIATS